MIQNDAVGSGTLFERLRVGTGAAGEWTWRSPRQDGPYRDVRGRRCSDGRKRRARLHQELDRPPVRRFLAVPWLVSLRLGGRCCSE